MDFGKPPVDDKPDNVTGFMGWGKFLQNFGLVSAVCVFSLMVYMDFKNSYKNERDALIEFLGYEKNQTTKVLERSDSRLKDLTEELRAMRLDFRKSVDSLTMAVQVFERNSKSFQQKLENFPLPAAPPITGLR